MDIKIEEIFKYFVMTFIYFDDKEKKRIVEEAIKLLKKGDESA